MVGSRVEVVHTREPSIHPQTGYKFTRSSANAKIGVRKIRSGHAEDGFLERSTCDGALQSFEKDQWEVFGVG